MKLTFILFILSFQIWAQPKSNPAQVDFTQEEVNQFLRTAKAQKVEDQLSNSDIFKHCKENKQSIEDVENCIQTAMTDNPDFDPEEFADKIDLKSYDNQASRDTKSIRAYLSERIQNAIYGEQTDDKKLKKIADHNVFNKLYRSQVGKNILMEVSNYCLVNLGVQGKPNILIHQGIDYSRRGRSEVLDLIQDPKKKQTFQARATLFSESLKGPRISLKDANNQEVIANNSLQRKFVLLKKLPDPNDPNKSTYTPKDILVQKFSDAGFTNWKDAFEYEICDNKDGTACKLPVEKKDGTTEKVTMRTTELINAMKEVEFQLGPEYMKQKYQFCAFSAISHMCELYKCSFEYSANTIEEKKKYCRANFGIEVNLDIASRDTPDYKVGIKACGLVAKLKEYRKALSSLDVLDEANQKLYSKRGFHGSSYKGGFHGTKGDDSVEDITTISSHDLTENVKLGLNEEETEKLRDECLSSGSLSEEEKCQALIEDINELDTVAEHEAETQAYMKRVDSLQDKDSIKEYLIKNGLHKYAAQVEDMDDDILKQLIKDEYKSEREAFKQSMMEKFNRLTKKAPPAGTDPSDDDFEENLEDVAETSIKDLENKKQRIQTLFQYNNVISSYMEAEYEESGDTTDLSYIREAELQGVKRYDEGRADEYDQKLNEGQESMARKGGESLGIDIQFIDQLLNN